MALASHAGHDMQFCNKKCMICCYYSCRMHVKFCSHIRRSTPRHHCCSCCCCLQATSCCCLQATSCCKVLRRQSSHARMT